MIRFKIIHRHIAVKKTILIRAVSGHTITKVLHEKKFVSMSTLIVDLGPLVEQGWVLVVEDEHLLQIAELACSRIRIVGWCLLYYRPVYIVINVTSLKFPDECR